MNRRDFVSFLAALPLGGLLGRGASAEPELQMSGFVSGTKGWNVDCRANELLRFESDGGLKIFTDNTDAYLVRNGPIEWRPIDRGIDADGVYWENEPFSRGLLLRSTEYGYA